VQEIEMLKEAIKQLAGVRCCMYCGKLTLMERTNSVQEFGQDAGLRVMLVQIRCRGTGLNLQMASYVIITTPSWNPCKDLHALCRSYRQGQCRDVLCERLVIKGTVEEKCIDLQQEKLNHSKELFTDPSFSLRLGFAVADDKNIAHL